MLFRILRVSLQSKQSNVVTGDPPVEHVRRVAEKIVPEVVITERKKASNEMRRFTEERIDNSDNAIARGGVVASNRPVATSNVLTVTTEETPRIIARVIEKPTPSNVTTTIVGKYRSVLPFENKHGLS